jgi:hypothetical protein
LVVKCVIAAEKASGFEAGEYIVRSATKGASRGGSLTKCPAFPYLRRLRPRIVAPERTVMSWHRHPDRSIAAIAAIAIARIAASSVASEATEGPFEATGIVGGAVLALLVLLVLLILRSTGAA